MNNTGEKVRSILFYLTKERTKNGRKSKLPLRFVSTETGINYETIYNFIRKNSERASGYQQEPREEHLRVIIDAFHYLLPHDQPEWKWIIEYAPKDSNAGMKQQIQALQEQVAHLTELVAEFIMGSEAEKENA